MPILTFFINNAIKIYYFLGILYQPPQGVIIDLLLLDRGFFAVDVINTINDMGVDWPMPCTNTSGVVGRCSITKAAGAMLSHHTR